MPAAIEVAQAIYAGSEAFAALAPGTVFAAVVQTALVVGSAVQAQRAKKQAADAAAASYKDRLVTVRSSDYARTVVYGRTRVGGPVLYACTHGAKKEFLTMVIPVAAVSFECLPELALEERDIAFGEAIA